MLIQKKRPEIEAIVKAWAGIDDNLDRIERSCYWNSAYYEDAVELYDRLKELGFTVVAFAEIEDLKEELQYWWDENHDQS